MSRTPAASLPPADEFTQAMTAWEKGDLPETRRLARRITESAPAFGGGHYLLGLVALRQGQPRRAVEHLERAVAADPRQAVPRLALGQAREAQNDSAGALQTYREILLIDPRHAEAHARLAEGLARQGQREAAAAHCRSALLAHPRHAEALNTLGALLHEEGRDAEAAVMLRRALDERPSWAVALHNFGLVLTALGQLDAAVTILEGAVSLRPGHGPDRIALAAALRRLGQFDRALAEAEHATRLSPGDVNGWLELGLAREALGSAEGAAAAFERAIAADAASVHAHWCLAETCRLRGRTERAERHYRLCLTLDPEDRHGAALGLAHLGLAPAPDRAPDAYVRRLFDDYAGRFDAALVDGLAYRGPEVLAEALSGAGLGDGLSVLDAGCGTGLAGRVLRPFAARLDGVDLSAAMVEQARGRGLYDDLVVGDLVRTLADRAATYDLVAAADVLVYLGDLAPVFAACATALRPKGLFAFTVERDDDAPPEPGFRLGPHNRYAHGPEAIRRRAEAAGFTVLHLEPAVTRHEGGAPVPGLVCLLRAPTPPGS